MIIEVHTFDRELLDDLKSAPSNLTGPNNEQINLQFKYDHSYIRKGTDFPFIDYFNLQILADTILRYGRDIAVGLIAAWIYDKVKNRKVEKFSIEKTEITEISKDNIKKVLIEKIEKN